MAIKANRKRVVVEEMTKFIKGRDRVSFELIKESRIPGKYLPTAMSVVQKIKSTIQVVR